MANSVWLLVAIVAMIVYLSLGVIAREEAHLSCKFGDEYIRYRSSHPALALTICHSEL